MSKAFALIASLIAGALPALAFADAAPPVDPLITSVEQMPNQKGSHFKTFTDTDMEMVHINFGDKELLIIADRTEINEYFSLVIDSKKSSCGLLGREIVLAQ